MLWHVMGVCVKSVFYLTSKTDVSLTVAPPSLTALPPSVPSAQLSPCLPGTGLISQQRWRRTQPARVTHRDGDGGQESIWTHAHSPSHTPRDSAFPISHIIIPPAPQIGVVVVVMVVQVAVSVRGGYVVLLFHPGAPSNCFGTASTVMTLAHFHFHQTRKCRGMKGLSLNSQLLD